MTTELTPELIAERIKHFGPLKAGTHEPNGDACVMEAVAFVAGEPWSAHPECACPVIGAFLRSWNDALNDGDRETLLRPLIPSIIGTRSTKTLENQRAAMAMDWLVRTHLPAWLRLAGLTEHANALSGLPDITNFSRAPSLKGPLDAAWDAAWEAARAAATATGARAAAMAAARAAAMAAAWDAAWEAARAAATATGARAAAMAAARAAAMAAAWDAAWEAAGEAARDALLPTQKELQKSALELLKCMIAAQ